MTKGQEIKGEERRRRTGQKKVVNESGEAGHRQEVMRGSHSLQQSTSKKTKKKKKRVSVTISFPTKVTHLPHRPCTKKLLQ